jgi:bifunctional non-homologous end joining protein LigD
MVSAARRQQRSHYQTRGIVDWRAQGKSAWRFFVKLHDATSLHYDFRLEYDGVLLSWVLPRGPCLDANVGRLAKRVGDHQINDFEGTLPAGMYGAGTVMLWDQGFWTTDQNVHEALRNGLLNFQLDGAKLKGSWTLTRRHDRSDQSQTKWVLSKGLDAEARSLRAMDIVTAQPRSVSTRRPLEKIARGMPSLIPGRPPRKQTRDPAQRLLFPDVS